MYPAVAMLMSFIGVAHLYWYATSSQRMHCYVLQKFVAKRYAVQPTTMLNILLKANYHL